MNATSPRIRAFTIQAADHLYFRACKAESERAAEAICPGRKLTNSEAFALLLAEHRHATALLKRLDFLIGRHFRAEAEARPSPLTPDAYAERLGELHALRAVSMTSALNRVRPEVAR